MNTLYIIIPAYNEEENIESVIRDWYPVVEQHNGEKNSRLVIIDDGSRDNTYQKICSCAEERPLLVPVTKKNSGHGPTILYGYHYALEHGADYIFHTDSDGQTLASEFEGFWQQRSQYDMVIGYRKFRKDGVSRVFVAKTLRHMIQLFFHVHVRDANTPYRLMKAESLGEMLTFVPPGYNLTNVLLSVLFARKKYAVHYEVITFRPRQGGKNSINMKRIFGIGKQAVHDFYEINRSLKTMNQEKHVLTVTLNPCIDRTLRVSRFKMGATNQVLETREEVAGKGINVAIGLQNLSIPVYSFGILFADEQKRMKDKLEQAGIPAVWYKVPGSLRVNTKIFDESNHCMTECNERGTQIEEKHEKEILQLFDSNLNGVSVLVLSGSVAPGFSTDIYAKMIQLANRRHITTILDTSGELLLKGCKQKPYMIKPNLEEFIKAFGGEKESLAKTARHLNKQGVSNVCISLGEEGAVLYSGQGEQHSRACKTTVCGLQGAGDAMVAGAVRAIWNKNQKMLLADAMAYAAATVSCPGTQMGSRKDFERFLQQIDQKQTEPKQK